MAHNLTTNETGRVEFVASSHVSVWHGLGQRVDGLMTTEQVYDSTGINFPVEKRELTFMGNDGEQISVPDSVAIVRADIQKVLSIMKKSYAIIDPETSFQIGDILVGEGKAHWATAGSIDGGKKIFMQAEIGDSLFIGGRSDEEIKRLMLIANSFDGSIALVCMLTPVRVVCQNTLNASLSTVSSNANAIKIYHRKGYSSKIEEAHRVLGLANDRYEEFKAGADRLIEKEVTSSYVEGFLEALIPSSAEEESTRTLNRRAEIENLFRNGAGNHGKTRWDLFNAVTEYVDHYQGGRVTEKMKGAADVKSAKAEQRIERSVFGIGARLKQSASALLQKA